jgi:cytochrome c oxidase subunit 4
MSDSVEYAPPAEADEASPALGTRDERFWLFVKIAGVLAVVTSIEIAILFMHVEPATQVGVLVLSSVLKFALEVYIFMHLKWDKLFCMLLFLLGLSLAAGTVTALLAVFRVEDSTPLTSKPVATLGSLTPVCLA